MNRKVIELPKKLFLIVVITVGIFMIFSTALTYILPKGNFLVGSDNVVDYSQFILASSQNGLPIYKAILAPILVLTSSDSLSLIMLSIFLLTIGGIFQVMMDNNGMYSIVYSLTTKFGKNKKQLIAALVLVFMCFGSFFGLFEETLVLLPMMMSLMIMLGYDSYTGFLVCIVSTGLGFSAAITNPFTVLYASTLIDASVTSGILLRIIFFCIMYGLVLLFVFKHIKSIEKDKKNSPTYEYDVNNDKVLDESKFSKKHSNVYTKFFIFVVLGIITCTSIPAIRDYTVVLLILVFLIGGIISAFAVGNSGKFIAKTFFRGVLTTLPAIIIVIMSASIKYILIEGNIIDTITNYINTSLVGTHTFKNVLILFGIIICLEFFISSSTAKAIFVMGVLNGVIISSGLGISKELVVLTYVFSDGFTNLLFPTSTVLLLGLSMTKINYFKWLKKSSWLFLVVVLLEILFLYIATILY